MSRIYVIHENDAWLEPLEEKAGTYGMRAVASFLGRELRATRS